VSGLIFGVRKGIVIFDRAAKPIYCFGSPVVANYGASTFRIWRWPRVRDRLLIVFAVQTDGLLPHLGISVSFIRGAKLR
jgi:hypothetical protein